MNMENNKEKMVKLSTLICTIVISLLVIVAICLYFYFNPIEKTISNSSFESTNSKGSTSLNMLPNETEKNNANSTANEQSNTTIAQNENSSSGTITQTGKYDIQYVKDTITINGKKHTYEIRYSSNMNLISTENAYYNSDTVILLDNKVVKNTTIGYFEENKTKDNIKVSIIKNKYGDIKKEFLVFCIEHKIGETGTKENVFYFVDENAEIIETINFGYGKNIYIDGQSASYELKEDRLIWYEENGYQETEEDIAVVKYEMYIIETTIGSGGKFKVLKTYKSSEVELEGK